MIWLTFGGKNPCTPNSSQCVSLPPHWIALLRVALVKFHVPFKTVGGLQSRYDQRIGQKGYQNLPVQQAKRVQDDNAACDFVLQEIMELAQRGGTSLRENPWRSLHWHLPREKAMFDTGEWWDTHYASCVFAGARCKSQRLRHNVEEINAWPPLDCQHSHDPKEWDPYLVNGQAVFPSKEEAEYTAPLAFAIAVAVSWWACRTGKATLHIPRMPSVERHGRREHWIGLDARCMRQWAMAPLAISLGLRPPDADEAARIPVRAIASDIIREDGTLPGGCIYVGRGHHSHRLQTTVEGSGGTGV